MPITEIRVCAGTYAENLTLTTATSLRGGYSCDTWGRAERFGFDANFPDVNSTIVEGVANAPTLTVDAPTATQATVIDGFQIRAANSAGQPAIKVVAGAASIAELEAFGGAATGGGSGAASLGIQVVGGAPDLGHVRVDGGKGVGSDYGSVAVQLSGGAANLHDSRLEAGDGKGLVGATGVLINGGNYTGANALSRLIVHGARPTGENNPFIGIQILTGKVEVLTSIVLGVDGASCASSLCTVYGIAGSRGAEVVVRGNSVEPGNFANEATGFRRHRGVYSNGSIVVENNLISAGGLSETTPPIVGSPSDGGAIELGPEGAKPVVRFNTLVLGAPVRSNIIRYGLVSMAAGAEVYGNLVIREPQSGTGSNVRAFDFRPCGDKPFAVFDGNRAIGAAPYDVILGPPTTTCTTTVKVGDYSFNGIFKNGDGGGDNTSLPDTARKQTFGAWNATQIARAISERKLVPGAGPGATNPCKLQTTAAGPATDALDVPRPPNKPTAGAFEGKGNCTP